MPTPRFSIARMMGFILGAGLMFGCMARAPVPWWGTALNLMICGLLAIGVVALVCRKRSERAWWLGFVLFGWGYFALGCAAGYPWDREAGLQNEALTSSLLRKLGIGASVIDSPEDHWTRQIIHAVWTLSAAILGGGLSHLIAFKALRPTSRTSELSPTKDESLSFPLRRLLLGMTGPLLVLIAIILGSRSQAWPWAGGAFLLTWSFLGLTALGSVFSRPGLRPICLGATLFGSCYMIMIFGQPMLDPDWWPKLATNQMLESVRPWLPPGVSKLPTGSDLVPAANARIARALNRNVSIHFPRETTLEDFVKWLDAEARGPDGKGIPIYLDPIGLMEAEKAPSSTIVIELEDVPLTTCLGLALEQSALRYRIEDGVLKIGYVGNESYSWSKSDPFLVAGQCLIACLAACVGAVAAFFIVGPRGAS